MKKILCFALAMILSVGILAGCSKPAEEKKPEEQATEATDNEKVLLTAGDFQMTKKQANIYLYSTKLDVERLGMGPTIWVNEIQPGKTFEAAQLEQLRQTLTYIAVMNEEAKKKNITLNDEDKKSLSQAGQIIQALHPMVNEYYGFTEEEFKRFLETQMLAVKATEEETKGIEVDEAKLKERYEADKNYQMLQTIGKEHYFDQVRARHILISTLDPSTQTPLAEDKKAEAKKKAEELLVKARSGEDFAELAKANTDDPSLQRSYYQAFG